MAGWISPSWVKWATFSESIDSMHLTLPTETVSILAWLSVLLRCTILESRRSKMARDMVQEDIEADETTALNTTSDHDSSSSYGALNKLASTTDDENFVATDPQRSGSPETREPDDRRISGNVWGVISVLLLGACSHSKMTNTTYLTISQVNLSPMQTPRSFSPQQVGLPQSSIDSQRPIGC